MWAVYRGPHVTSQDFIKLWEKFFAFILLVLNEISQGFKLLTLLKALFENYFKLYYFLKNFFGKNQISKY
jgi:hypothetical protein